MNKKLIVSIICILLVISISLVIVVNNSYSNKTVLSDGEVNTEKNNTSNMLTMMYETEADSGEYQIASDTNWLSGDYVFNETLSRCENGSDLRWDDTTNRVIIEATTADKCYVYFDLFTGVNLIYAGGTPIDFSYSTDNGGSWTAVSNVTSNMTFAIGTQIKTSSYQQNVVFCSGSTCSISDSTKLGIANNGTPYIITGEEVSYAYYSFVCLTKDTYVYVYDKKKKMKRKKRIKDIKVGDLVYSFNDQENKYTYSKVKKVEITHTKAIYAIKLQNGETIRCSSGHNFYVAGMDYLKASQLKPGFKLLGLDNKSYEIVEVNQEFYEDSIELYNLYTDKDSSNKCFVSSVGVLSMLLVLGFYLFPMQSYAIDDVSDSS